MESVPDAYLQVVLPVPPALLSPLLPVLPRVSADDQDSCLPVFRSCLYPQIEKEAAQPIHFFLHFHLYSLLSPHWRSKAGFAVVFLYYLLVTCVQGGFRIFRENKNPLPLNAAWGRMIRTILSLKVSHVCLSCDSVVNFSAFLSACCQGQLWVCCCLLQLPT